MGSSLKTLFSIISKLAIMNCFRNCPITLAIYTVLAFALAPGLTIARDWMDITGKHSIEADFVALKDGIVTLRKSDGEVTSLPIVQLSKPDQRFATFLALDGKRYLADLVSKDNVLRRKAAKTLSASNELPPEATDSILEFLRAEISGLSNAGGTAGTRIKIDSIKRVGNEVSLVRVKADPQQFIDKTFAMIVLVSPSSYFNYGYNNAESTHYSLQFREVNLDGSVGGTGHLYVSRTFSDLLVERVIKTVETGAKYQLLRVEVTLDSDRYEGASSYDLLELQDWQYYDATKSQWNSNALDGLAFGLKCLQRVSDTKALVDIVKGNGIKASPAIDNYIRRSAIDSLVDNEGKSVELDTILGLITDPRKYGGDAIDGYIRKRATELLGKGDASRTDVEKLVDLISASEEHVNRSLDQYIRTAAIQRIKGLNQGMQGYAERRLKTRYTRGRKNDSELAVKWTTQAVKTIRFGK